MLRLVATGRTNREIAAILVDQRAHRRPPRAEHLPQARPVVASGGDGVRLRARPHRVMVQNGPRGPERSNGRSGRCGATGRLRTFDPCQPRPHANRRATGHGVQPLLRDVRGPRGPLRRRRLLRPLPAVLAVPAAGRGGLRVASCGRSPRGRRRPSGPCACVPTADRVRHRARGGARDGDRPPPDRSARSATG